MWLEYLQTRGINLGHWENPSIFFVLTSLGFKIYSARLNFTFRVEEKYLSTLFVGVFLAYDLAKSWDLNLQSWLSCNIPIQTESEGFDGWNSELDFEFTFFKHQFWFQDLVPVQKGS